MAKISQDSFPKDGGGGWGGAVMVFHTSLVGNSAAAEETFKIQIAISKMSNFAFKCSIFY